MIRYPSMNHYQGLRQISWDDLLKMTNKHARKPSIGELRPYFSSSSQFERQMRVQYRLMPYHQFSSISITSKLRRFSGINASNDSAEMDSQKAWGLLKLSKFSRSEIDWRFDQIVLDGSRKKHDSEYTDSTDRHSQSFDELKSAMHQSDLEVHLFRRYLRLEDEWNARQYHNIINHEDLSAKIDDSKQIQLQFEKAMEVQKQQRIRISTIREFARKDAASIFHLLLSHVPSEQISNIDNTTTFPIKSNYVNSTITKDQFYSSIHTLATQIHYPTILPLASSMLLVGASVGVISPIMPFLAAKLDLTTSQYGIVVSSFALSKMLGNVPSAIAVERHGRKPYLVHSFWLVGFGVAGLGLSNTWVELSLCRMTIGLGVAALTTASTLTVADVSTPLSRASTFSPVMSAFAAGTALGPALGGLLADGFGIRDTFLMVAASYGVVGVWNRVSLRETGKRISWMDVGGGERLPWHDDFNDVKPLQANNSKSKMSDTISHALKDTFDQWSSLLNDEKVRPIVIMNGFYLMAISGTQMTLLPLLLTNGGANTAATGMALSATTMGQVFMWMSAVQVLSNPAAGRFADKMGKHTAIIAGGVLTGVAMGTVPVICSYGLMAGDHVTMGTASEVNWPLLAATLGIWSLGGTLLATSHVAAISDAVSDVKRSQAIALLRTAGDVGFLCGALGAGLAADSMGDVGFAMQAGSAVLMGATSWFGFQSFTSLYWLICNSDEKKMK